MVEADGAFEVPGDRSPDELADHLGWPHDLVAQLVADGRIVRTASGWRVDVAAELRQRWARALWNGESDGESDKDT
ncbi:MAG TPA: hypothetical protein VFU35_09820 [Jatrophihabitans sp.]|nr:hypothetical protein [Jatrophihabitans sp.]